MRRVLLLVLSHLMVAFVVYFTTIHFGSVQWKSNSPLDNDKNIFIIVAVADNEADEDTTEAYFRQHVLAPGNNILYSYVKDGKMFGFTGFIFSKRPLQNECVVPRLW